MPGTEPPETPPCPPPAPQGRAGPSSSSLLLAGSPPGTWGGSWRCHRAVPCPRGPSGPRGRRWVGSPAASPHSSPARVTVPGRPHASKNQAGSEAGGGRRGLGRFVGRSEASRKSWWSWGRASPVSLPSSSCPPWEGGLGLCRAVPRCAVLSRAMLCHIVPCRAVPRLLCHIAPCCAILCRAVPYCTVLCHTVLCRAVLYSTVPCRAVPCSAVPCRAVLRGWLLSPCRPPCAGAGSWLCLLEALRIPVLGSLAFKTSPGTEAVGSCNKQPKGSDDARAWR